MVESTTRRSPVPTNSSDRAEPWWMDAQLFFPIFLGPLAFLITVFPAIESLTQGGSLNLQSLFMKALIRLLLFCVIGYVGGFLLRWVMMVLESGVGEKVDVTVNDQSAPKKKRLEPETISVPVSTEYIEPGMKLAKPVISGDGKQLIASGVLLTNDLIELGQRNGIETWKIEGLKYVIRDSEEKSEG